MSENIKYIQKSRLSRVRVSGLFSATSGISKKNIIANKKE